MLIKVDLPAVIKVMGKGVLVMLMGTAGVMVGGVVAYVIVHGWLPEDSWRGFGALAGSWIGGTGNMTAAHAALEGTAEDLTLAAAADGQLSPSEREIIASMAAVMDCPVPGDLDVGNIWR